MKTPEHKYHHLRNYDYASPGFYFVTLCARVRNQDIFSSIASVGAADPGGPAVRLTDLGLILENLILSMPHAYPDLTLDQYVIMPDHIHLLLQLEWAEPQDNRRPRTSLPKVVNALKGLAARRWGSPIWQDDYYDHIVRNDSDLQEVRAYIQQNPRKWLLDKD